MKVSDLLESSDGDFIVNNLPSSEVKKLIKPNSSEAVFAYSQQGVLLRKFIGTLGAPLVRASRFGRFVGDVWTLYDKKTANKFLIFNSRGNDYDYLGPDLLIVNPRMRGSPDAIARVAKFIKKHVDMSFFKGLHADGSEVEKLTGK